MKRYAAQLVSVEPRDGALLVTMDVMRTGAPVPVRVRDVKLPRRSIDQLMHRDGFLLELSKDS